MSVGTSAQGASREAALDGLEAVVEAITGGGRHEPTDEEIRALGGGPDIARSQGGEFQDVIK